MHEQKKGGRQKSAPISLFANNKTNVGDASWFAKM